MTQKKDDLPTDVIVKEYLAGETSTSLGKRYGVSSHAILRLLRKANIRIRSKGGSDKVYDEGWTAAFVAAYQAGEAIMSIAERMGVGHGTVWRALHSANIPPRPHGLRTRTVTVPTDPFILGYFAGLLDGEGNLQMKPKHDGKSVGCKLAIYNTNADVMAWLEGNIGGKARWDHKRVEREGWLPIGIWEIYRARDVAILLHAVLPLLIVKRQTAETMLALFDEVFGLDHLLSADKSKGI